MADSERLITSCVNFKTLAFSFEGGGGGGQPSLYLVSSFKLNTTKENNGKNRLLVLLFQHIRINATAPEKFKTNGKHGIRYNSTNSNPEDGRTLKRFELAGLPVTRVSYEWSAYLDFTECLQALDFVNGLVLHHTRSRGRTERGGEGVLQEN